MSKLKQPTHSLSHNDLSNKYQWHGWLVFILGVFMYSNTLMHSFTQDDAIVIYDNMFTTQGVKGLNGLFTKDTFYGFFKEEGKQKLVSGGRYRPFTPAMFAVEWQLVGKKPWLGHLINILLYGLLCFWIYKLLTTLLSYKDKSERMKYLALAIAVIYAAHPIHTEAVANIKGRDEIMSMLGSVFALLGIIKFHDTKNRNFLILALISFFVGLLSKENTITYLAIVPLALYFFREVSVAAAIRSSALLLVPTFIFLLMRSAILGNDFGGLPMELMNNPFLKIVDGNYVSFSTGEKMATIMHTLGRYLQLLVFPHPLTHDYYPRHIEMMSFSQPRVLLDVSLYAVLSFIALKGLKNKSIISFAILYFFITLSIVSNIVFPIGTNMSERFMFMPSLGFAIFLGYLLIRFVYDTNGKKVWMVLMVIIMSLYGLKTITRNAVWESDFKLFTTDVHISKNSAKVLNAAGGSLIDKYAQDENVENRERQLSKALEYLNKATEIHPTYKNAYLLKGNAHFFMSNYELAVDAYNQALRLDPSFPDAIKNQAIALREAGKYAGEKQGDLSKAALYLEKSYLMVANDMETVRLLGVLNGIKGNHQEAFKFFKIVSDTEPNNANAYLNLSTAYRNLGDVENAERIYQKALSIDPNVLKGN